MRLIFSLLGLAIFLAFWSPGVWAQQPEVVWQLKSLPGAESDDPTEVSLYSNGRYLSFVIEVRDEGQVLLDDDPTYCDHVELWLSLAPQEFPVDYPFNLHPEYLVKPETFSTPGAAGPRFFSIRQERDGPQNLGDFLGAYDYPADEQVKEKGLNVPLGSNLQKARIDAGMVCLAFFPDGRPAEVVNRSNFYYFEDALGIRLGDFSEGVIYSAEQQVNGNGGYTLNVQLDLRALGFVTAPEVNSLALAVDHLEAPGQGRLARITQSTQIETWLRHPAFFEKVDLKEPLEADILGVPASVLRETGERITCVYTDRGWRPFSIDADALVFEEELVSNDLLEVGFFPVQVSYEQKLLGDLTVELLRIDREFVNALPEVHREVRVGGIWIDFKSLPENPGDPDLAELAAFRFGNGQPGLIITERQHQHPFGWGDCPTCTHRRLKVLRITPQGPTEILRIHQYEGPEPRCVIGREDVVLDGYRVSQLDWVSEGDILVVRLDEQNTRRKMRVKVTWDSEWKQPKVERVR